MVWVGLQGDLDGLQVVRDGGEAALEKAGFEGETIPPTYHAGAGT